MTPLIDATKAMQETMQAFSDLRLHSKSEPYKRTVDWIECLLAQHQVAMTSCAPAKLPDVQVRIKQLMAMRSALVDPGGAFTGYTFD